MFEQNQILHILTPTRVWKFRNKVQVGRSDECWPWIGAKRTDGYGAVKVDGQILKAHRISQVIATGRDIPEGMVVDHLCFNKGCVNPSHLEVISQGENMARYFKKKAESDGK